MEISVTLEECVVPPVVSTSIIEYNFPDKSSLLRRA
jgi:hypothetical protein